MFIQNPNSDTFKEFKETLSSLPPEDRFYFAEQCADSIRRFLELSETDVAVTDESKTLLREALALAENVIANPNG